MKAKFGVPTLSYGGRQDRRWRYRECGWVRAVEELFCV